jgi:hypothetical protein
MQEINKMQEYKVTIDDKGTQRWYNEDGQLHRENDKPALVYKNGNQFWFKNGKRHRENGPAVIYHNGDQYWYLKGRRHREDGPAAIHANGDKCWYKNGVYHREDGPAIIYANGTECWYNKDGKLHREDGPAVICAAGREEYWVNGVWQLNPNDVKELTVAEIEELLGYRVKIVK